MADLNVSRDAVLRALLDQSDAMIRVYGAPEAYDIFQKVTTSGMTPEQAITAMEKAGIQIHRVANGDIITYDTSIEAPTSNINTPSLPVNAKDSLKIGKATDSTKTNNISGMSGSTANSTISNYGVGSNSEVSINGYSSSKVVNGVYEAQPAKIGVSRKFTNGVEVLDKPKVTLSSNMSHALSMAGSMVNAGVTIGSAFYTVSNLIGVDKMREYLPEKFADFMYGDNTSPTIQELILAGEASEEQTIEYLNYILEDDYVYNLKYASYNGFFNTGGGLYIDLSNANINNSAWGDKLYITTGTEVTADALLNDNSYVRKITTNISTTIFTMNFTYAPFNRTNFGSMVVGGENFTAQSDIDGTISNLNINNVTYLDHTVYYAVDRGWDFTGILNGLAMVTSTAPIIELKTPIGTPPDDFINNTKSSRGNPDIWDYIAWLMFFGKIGGGSSGFEGLNIIGDTPKDWITPDDPFDKVRNKYREKQPNIYGNRLEVDIVQDDGTEKTYVYVPIPMPIGGQGEEPITDGLTQDEEDKKVKPNDPTTPKITLDTLLELISGVKPNPNPEPSGDYRGMETTPTLPNPTIPTPPPTGGGDTPLPIIPTGVANALWSIYNPTLEQVKSLGGWLWSSTFADQILKVLADPMQAIISLHKVFGSPSISGTGEIKVGYLSSGISGVNIVDNQYTHIDCGSVNLYEYFGNVFDYPPYTDIQIYLPFIGIVPIRVEDVLRSTITVTYDIDVLTGACLANINVLRDNAGGILYTYNGNCAVQYPLSSGSYLGLSSALLGLIGGAFTAGVAGAVIGGVMGAMNGKGTNIERSGNLSGNAGAMGIKKPYVIISRPITAMATDYQKYMGIPTNSLARIGDCKGFVSCKEVFIKSGTFESGKKQNLTAEQANEIESLLKNGVIIN